VIGEWCGDTADEAFAAVLLSDWRLVRRVPLPNWTDTAHELSVWERRQACPQLPGKAGSAEA
jgi:hypothetical protein